MYIGKNKIKQVRCNPDVAQRWNCGRVAYFGNAMSVDFQYADVYVIHHHHQIIRSSDHHHHIIISSDHHHHHQIIRSSDHQIIRSSDHQIIRSSDHQIIIIIIIITITIITITITIIIIMIMVFIIIPYELWMKVCWCYYQIQHICHRGWILFGSLMKICWSWCHFQVQHICQRGCFFFFWFLMTIINPALQPNSIPESSTYVFFQTLCQNPVFSVPRKLFRTYSQIQDLAILGYQW